MGSFIPTHTSGIINPFKERALGTNLISATTQKPSPKIIHCQTCSQHTSLICTHMPTWTWVSSTRRRHRLSTSYESKLPSKLETPIHIKQKFHTWWWSIFEYSMPQDNPKSEPHPHMKERSEKSKPQLKQGIFMFLGLVRKRTDGSCFWFVLCSDFNKMVFF